MMFVLTITNDATNDIDDVSHSQSFAWLWLGGARRRGSYLYKRNIYLGTHATLPIAIHSIIPNIFCIHGQNYSKQPDPGPGTTESDQKSSHH